MYVITHNYQPLYIIKQYMDQTSQSCGLFIISKAKYGFHFCQLPMEVTVNTKEAIMNNRDKHKIYMPES